MAEMAQMIGTRDRMGPVPPGWEGSDAGGQGAGGFPVTFRIRGGWSRTPGLPHGLGVRASIDVHLLDDSLARAGDRDVDGEFAARIPGAFADVVTFEAYCFTVLPVRSLSSQPRRLWKAHQSYSSFMRFSGPAWLSAKTRLRRVPWADLSQFQ